jgi:hypothetical protein
MEVLAMCVSTWLRPILLLFILFTTLIPSQAAASSQPILWHTFTTANGIAGNIVQTMWEDPAGNLWFGTENGASQYDGVNWTTYRMEDGLVDNNVWSITGDAQSVWFATTSGISQLSDGAWHTYTMRDGIPSNDVRAILLDKDKNIWIGTFGGGIARLAPGGHRWESVDLSSRVNTTNIVVQALWESADGKIWAGTNGIGALVISKDSVEQYKFRDQRHNTVWAIGARQQDPNVWLSTFSGIVRTSEQGATVESAIIDNIPISETEILAIAGAVDDTMWLGTRAQGVFHWTPQGWDHFTSNTGLSRNYVQAILADSHNRVWFGTRGGGVTLRVANPTKSDLDVDIQIEDIRQATTTAAKDAVLTNRQNTLRFLFTANWAWTPSQDVSFHYWLGRVGDVPPVTRSIADGVPATTIGSSTEVFVDLKPGKYELHVVPIIESSHATAIEGISETVSFTIQSAAPIMRAGTVYAREKGHMIPSGSTLESTLFEEARHVLIEYEASDDATPSDRLQYEYSLGEMATDWHSMPENRMLTLPREGEYIISLRSTDEDHNISEPVRLMVIVPQVLWQLILQYVLVITAPSILSAVGAVVFYRKWSRWQAFRRAAPGHIIPYDVGTLITAPERYFGRESILNTILGKIENNHFYVYGEKRIGKTSLLLQIQHRLRQRNEFEDSYLYVPIFRNMQDLPQEQFWSLLIKHIATEVSSARDELMVFKESSVNYDDFVAGNDLRVILNNIRSRDEQREPMIVLLLDEVDTFQRYDRVIRQRFRALCQELQRNLRVVLVGVLPPRAEVGENSPWYNIFEPIVIEPLAQSDIQALIRTYNQNPYSYTPDAEVAISEASNGKPYDTQWLCSEAVKSMLSVRRNRVTVSDVEQAKQAIIRVRHESYTLMWNHILEPYQTNIRTAALGDGLLSPQVIALPEYEELLTEGVILRTRQGTRLARLFQEWYRMTYGGNA